MIRLAALSSLVACWLLTPIPAHSQCSEPLFSLSKVLLVGDEPRGVLAADFNHDAIQDVAVTCQGPVGAGVWLSLGSLDGGAFNFGPPTVFTTGSLPSSLTSADMNRDGNQDLLVVTNGAIAILHGNGAGGFAAPGFHSSLPNPTDVATGDFNADGYLDMAVTHIYNPVGQGGYVSVILSDGEGGFSAPVPHHANNSTTSVTVGDVNEDGIADLVVCVPDAFKFQVFVGTGDAGVGDGNFDLLPSSTCVSPCHSPMNALIADFDHDGHLDLVERSYGSFSSLRLNLGDGDGTFPQVQHIPSGLFGGGPVAGDWNHDGNLDLALVDATKIFWSLGLGNGLFQTAPGMQAIGLPTEITSADMNRDGALDLITIHEDYELVTVLFGTCTTPTTDVEDPDRNANVDLRIVHSSPLALEIEFSLASAGAPHLALYDLFGRSVSQLDPGMRSAGRHRATWPIDRLSPGVYFVRMSAEGMARNVRAIIF